MQLHGLHDGLALLELLHAAEHVVEVVLLGVERGKTWYTAPHGLGPTGAKCMIQKTHMHRRHICTLISSVDLYT
jgi:hypothetical protein